jgi:hypothetical protein
LPLNQTNLGVLNQTITNWPPGAALWLWWQMTDSTGKAQGLGIDNLSFSASVLPTGFVAPPLAFQSSSGTNFIVSCSTTQGLGYQLEYADVLGSTNWIPLGGSVPGTGNAVSFNVTATNSQRFFRVQILP